MSHNLLSIIKMIPQNIDFVFWRMWKTIGYFCSKLVLMNIKIVCVGKLKNICKLKI